MLYRLFGVPAVIEICLIGRVGYYGFFNTSYESLIDIKTLYFQGSAADYLRHEESTFS
jgi:hypothetical protein